MPRALILGGTGAIGRATARRLLAAGWEVDVTGRNPARLPAELAAAGARFVAADRADDRQLRAALGEGADLLVDCICFTAADATRLAAARSRGRVHGADLEQGGLRRRRRKSLELGHGAALRRPDPRDAADDGARRRRLRLPRGLRREQGRRRAGPARQRSPDDGAPALQGSRRRRGAGRANGSSSSECSTGGPPSSSPAAAPASTTRRPPRTSPR